MAQVETGRIEGIDSARRATQLAIELEHATIPAYLTALYSVQPGRSAAVVELIHSIVVEEMFHMALACNLLNAIGGTPSIDAPDFVPKYPSALPLQIGSSPDSTFVMHLAPISRQVVKDVFMHVEEPEHDLDKTSNPDTPAPQYETIGGFYESLRNDLVRLGEGVFTGDPARQLRHGFRSNRLIAITDVKSASHAIDVILSQGEGSRTSPIDTDGRPAHFYRLAEIWHGRKLVKDPAAPDGHAYAGAAVTLDESAVWPMIEDPSLDKYAHDPDVLQAAKQVNTTYSKLLRQLHGTFNGAPDKSVPANHQTFALKVRLGQLMAMPVSGTDRTAGPTFDHVPDA